MESRIDNLLSKVQRETKFSDLNTSATQTLDNLVAATDNFLDRVPPTLKKIDTAIGVLIENIPSYLDKYPNLPAILGYGILGLISAYLSVAVLDAINDIPLLGSFFELAGLAYGIWFCIRYLLFASNREELKLKLDAIEINPINN